MSRYLGFQIKHLGDVLMSLPALGLIKKQCPEAKTAIVVRPQAAPLVRHPWVDEVFILEYRPRHFFRGNTRALAARLAEGGFDCSFHFDGQLRSGVLGRLSRLGKMVASPDLIDGKLRWPWLYNRRLALDFDGTESLSLRHQHLVAAELGLTPEPFLRPTVGWLPDKSIKLADQLIGRLSGGPKVGLSLRGLQLEKCWPLDYFAKVAAGLWSDYKASLFVTGMAADAPLAQRLAQLAGVPVHDFCGQTDLTDFIALARGADLFVSVDTGSCHLVALTETPLISIFTATNPAHWGAMTPRGRILCYDWALKRHGLKDGPWYGAPIVKPEKVLLEASGMLSELGF